MPYANHSSIVASNFRPNSLTKISRPFSRGYKPHLATISESQAISSPLRKQFSPKIHFHSTPKFIMPKPIKINTADIDVSINKYRKYDRSSRLQKPSEPVDVRESRSKSKSPSPCKSPTKLSLAPDENDISQKSPIRRDRALVRIKTIHRKESPTNNYEKRKPKWRENFVPSELNLHKDFKKSSSPPSEKINTKYEDETPKITQQIETQENEIPRTNRAEKSPSFHDICTFITSNSIDDDLNPGQPEDVKRKQSRHLLEEELVQFKQKSPSPLPEISENLQDNKETDASVEEKVSTKKKKKVLKKKSNEKLLVSDDEDLDIRSNLQRRPTKKYRRTSTDSSFASDLDPEREQAYQDAIRDISQVEVEEIKRKPKPIITATVDIEVPKPNLKLVVDEIEVVESPKKAEGKKFKFNVMVSEIEEKRRSIKKSLEKEINNNLPLCNLNKEKHEQDIKSTAKKKTENLIKTKISENEKGIVQTPKPKQAIESNIKIKAKQAQTGKVLASSELKKKIEHKNDYCKEQCKDIPSEKSADKENKGNLSIDSNIRNNKVLKTSSCDNLTKEKESVMRSLSEEAQKTTKVQNNVATDKLKTELGAKPKVKVTKQEKTNHEDFVSKLPSKSDNASTDNFWAKLGKSDSVENIQKGKHIVFDKKSLENETIVIERELNIEPSLPPKNENMSTENFWVTLGTRESQYWENRKRVKAEENSRIAINSINKNTEITQEQKDQLINTVNNDIDGVDVNNDGIDETVSIRGKIISKRSLINKTRVEDPDLQVFVPPTPPSPDPEPESTSNSSSFVPLQSNRLSAFMNPKSFKKPEQYEECPVEIYATPKVIRGRHYPRPRHPPPQPAATSSEESDETSEEDTSEEESDENVASGKIGASTSSNDSGFDSSAHGSPGNRKING